MATINVTTRKGKARHDDLYKLDTSLILSFSEEEDAKEMIDNILNNDGEEGDNEQEEEGSKTGLKPPPEESGKLEDPPKNNDDADPIVTAILDRLDSKFDFLHKGLTEFKASLEYSQKDVDDLKNENRSLKNRITQLELEEKRNEMQMTTLEGRLDKLDTYTKRKNLVLEGIEETQDGRDNFQPLFYQLTKQIGIDRSIDYDTCHRVGPFNKDRCRPIVITFQRQADRDEIYAKRAQMKKTADFHDVWLNEDLGQNSKRANTLIRLVAKEAQKQGIEHKASKYTIHIENKRYDERNLNELPDPLTLHNVKTIKIGKSIAYQSEHSKFSNFYPCNFRIGKHNYNSVEQAYHHLRARAHNKHVIALKILLKRKPIEIKQLGAEFEENEDWANKKLEVMLMCMTCKFEQCPDLAEALLETVGFSLIEATPDRFWAAGATLSSNVLRRGQWTGRNEQGKLLELVRELLGKKIQDA